MFSRNGQSVKPKHNNIDGRISASYITALNPGEIFVFGSNLSGIHGAGAAYTAYHRFGAELGVGEGLRGQSYAFPTVYYDIERSLTLDEIAVHAKRFLECVAERTDLQFLLTQVGCNLAGYTPQQMAPLFAEGFGLTNLFFPLSFYQVLVSNEDIPTLQPDEDTLPFSFEDTDIQHQGHS